MTRILGIDPGLRYMGWGIIDTQDNRLTYVADGVVAPDTTLDLPSRLRDLFLATEKLIQDYSPDEVAIEYTFVNVNGMSSLKLGYARAVGMVVPALKGLPVEEYAPKDIKKAIVGTGAASKEQITIMVKRLLPKAILKRADAADALAIAICHAHSRETRKRLAQMERKL